VWASWCWWFKKRCVTKREYQSRFFAKALPEGVFRYDSKSRALWRSEKAVGIASLIMGFEPRLKVFSKTDVKSILSFYGLQNVGVIESHGVPSRSFEKSL
jgi:hypothetical protein